MSGGTAVRCRAKESALPADLDPPAPILVPSTGVYLHKATDNERHLQLTQAPKWLNLRCRSDHIPIPGPCAILLPSSHFTNEPSFPNNATTRLAISRKKLPPDTPNSNEDYQGATSKGLLPRNYYQGITTRMM